MRRVVTVVAVLLALVYLAGYANILRETVAVGRLRRPWDRLHWNTGNTTRVRAANPEELGALLGGALWPAADVDTRPQACILVSPRVAWHQALALAPLLAHPARTVLLPLEGDGIDEGTAALLHRLGPTGLAAAGGAAVIAVEHGRSLALEAAGLGFPGRRIDAAAVCGRAVALRRGIDGSPPAAIVLAVAEEPEFALPPLAWCAHTGDLLLPVPSPDDGLPPAVQQVLDSFPEAPLYVTGPSGGQVAVLLAQLRQAGRRVRDIVANTAPGLSVAFAEYYDPERGWGWRARADAPEGGHNAILANPADWRQVLAASQLAVRGRFGPLLLTGPGRLPPSVENHLWRVKPGFLQTPSEGPWNHLWVVGDFDQVSYAVQGRADFTQEIAPYRQLGPQALSGVEALSLVWLFLTLVCAVWILAHLALRGPLVGWPMRLAWPLAGLVFGPVGLWAYLVAYQGFRPVESAGRPPAWQRPLWIQALVAAVGTVGPAMVAMVSAGFGLMFFGVPLTVLGGPLYVVGSPIGLMIIFAYAAALLAAGLAFVPGVLMVQMRLGYRAAVLRGAPPVLASVTAATAGMMSLVWWLQREYLPLPPEVGEVVWWGTVLFSALAGLAAAYVANWFLVAAGRSQGSM